MSAPKCDQYSGVGTGGSHTHVTNDAVLNTDQSMINTVEQMAWRSHTYMSSEQWTNRMGKFAHK